MIAIYELTEFQADLIKSFAMFFLLLVGNYIGTSIFTCNQVHFITSHKNLQLFISFLLFYFLVTVLSNTGKLKFIPPLEKLFYSIFYFLGFLIVMRLDMRISMIVLVLIFIIYFLELNKEFYLDENKHIDNTKTNYWITFNKIKLFKIKNDDFKYINKIETLIYYLILTLLVIGFISYGGEIRDTIKHSKNITWINVITDTNICNIKYKKDFWHYFKAGLGLSI
jgi:hypothetical protein